MVLYLYHVGGRLVRSAEGTDYIGREVIESHGDSEEAGFMTLRCWCKRHGHTKVQNIWYLMPGLSLNDGLILLTADDEGDRMFLDTCRMHKVVDVYLDHGEPVHPLFAEGPEEACHRLGINEKGQRLGERRGVVGETFTQGCGEAGTSRQAGEEEDFADLYDNVNGDGDDSSDEDFALSGDGDAESDSESVVDSEQAVQSVANLGDQGDNGEGERHEERWEATGYLIDDNDEELNFVMREKQRIKAEIRGAGGFNNDGGGPILEGSGAGDMEGNVGNLAEGDDDVNATDEEGGQTSNPTNVDQSQANETIMAQSQSNTTSVNLIPTQNSVVAPIGRQIGGGRGRGRARGRGRGRVQVQLPPTSLTVGTPSAEQPQLPPSNASLNGADDQLDDEALVGIPDEILASMGTNSNVEDNAQTNTEAFGLNTEVEDGGQVTATEGGQ
ncbi:hypothetical protein Tsubulata_024090 [Turnera subulata]|uniref:PB1-like domain-containing protein n=1 Tax=Turnera subulata TaxID=218843 RepID=A0A9Q0FK50_9ROSI|nr:hypothetical protein Tsubulata_024090 [Turnera subulata]